MAKITLNGKELEVPTGQNLVDAAKANGVEIPTYCYHPGLSIAGQCRMCVVEQEGNPKLQVACNMTCSDGLKVVTNSEKVQQAVKANLEFHLINHPIDCPICDQAGECGLQDYYMKHGRYASEMEEPKNLKEKVVDLGDHIVLDKERCILCSRCVRFTREVAKTNEFGIFDRGDRSTIGTFEDRPLTGNYQVNNVDICPVGALTSKDFRFEQRVWFLEESESICSGCSKGCNVAVHHKKGRHVYRLKPRYNKDVNQWWMCDVGRYTYKESNYDRRLSHPRLGGVELPAVEAAAMWASDLKMLNATERSDEIGIWLSPQLTNEELTKILDVFTTQYRASKFYSEDIEKLVKEDKAVDDFLYRSDYYPNSKGFLNILQEKKIKTKPTEEFIQGLSKNSISHAIIFAPTGQKIIPLMQKIARVCTPNHFVALLTPQLAVAEMFDSALSLPTLSHYEKTGTMTNHMGLDQKLSGGFKMFKESSSVQDLLQNLFYATELSKKERMQR